MMEDDMVPLSPRRERDGKIVPQSLQPRSFEDLLDEAVMKKKKKKKRKSGTKNKSLMPWVNSNLQLRSDGGENVAPSAGGSLQMDRIEEGHVNLAADFDAAELLENKEEKSSDGAQVPLPRLKLRQKILAPIRAPRGLKIPSLTQEEDPVQVVREVENELEEEDLLDATILNSPEPAKISSPSSFNSRHSDKEALLPSPAKSRHSLSASASSAPPSLKSTPEKKPQPKKRRRKLKEEAAPASQPIEMTCLKSGTSTAQQREWTRRPPSSEDRESLLTVTLHVCEVPLATMPASGIILKVHVVDVDTGCELQTSQEQVVASQSTGLRSKFRGKLALVEENLTFKAPLQLALENNVVIFLEIFVPRMNRMSSCYARIDVQERCVGWAFLKLRSASGHLNIDNKLRLQIYEPLGLPKFTPSQNFKTVYGWWCKGPWKKTRCSVFVTVTGLQISDNNAASRKSSRGTDNNNKADFPLLGEEGRQIEREKDSSLASLGSSSQIVDPFLVRNEGHLCKVTGQLSKSLSPPTFSCLSASFSKSGSLLAAASDQSIHIFKAPNLGLKCVLEGHEGLIYSVSWFDDKWLVSASADCLAIVWDVLEEKISKMLPHPTFVYCSKFFPDQLSLIVTGSKDKTLRVWKQAEDDGEFDLWQELDGHPGFITSICFDQNNILYSSDSEGAIASWTSQSPNHDWTKQRDFLLPDLKGVSICALEVHPNGKRILIYARDSIVRMLDVLSGVVLQTYQGALSHRIQSGMCLSPCGSLLMAGSEDGSIVVWQADTGKVLACISSSEDNPPATALAYHPGAHILAVGYFGPNPISIWIPDSSPLSHREFEARATPGNIFSPHQKNSSPENHLRLQDIIARIDRVLLANTAASPTK